MRIIISIFYTILFIIYGNNVYAQKQFSEDLNRIENNILQLFEFVSNSKNDDEKDLINNDIAEQFEIALKNPASFNYPFDSLKSIGKITSSDQRLRIYTWNIPYNNGMHKYLGFLQYIPEKCKTPIVFKLTDKSEDLPDPGKQTLNTDNWFGALYYDAIVIKTNDTRYYTLLGFDFNDLFSSKKIIEILYFNESNEPVFGKPIFEIDKKLFNRIIFEYSAHAGMSLKYNKESDMIIFDHLSPSKPSLTGNYKFYGPDMSYDGLKFENGRWILKKDIDIRN